MAGRSPAFLLHRCYSWQEGEGDGHPGPAAHIQASPPGCAQPNETLAERTPTPPEEEAKHRPIRPKTGKEGDHVLLAQEQAQLRCSLPTKRTSHNNRLLYHAFNTNLKKSGTIETVQI